MNVVTISATSNIRGWRRSVADEHGCDTHQVNIIASDPSDGKTRNIPDTYIVPPEGITVVVIIDNGSWWRGILTCETGTTRIRLLGLYLFASEEEVDNIAYDAQIPVVCLVETELGCQALVLLEYVFMFDMSAGDFYMVWSQTPKIVYPVPANLDAYTR